MISSEQLDGLVKAASAEMQTLFQRLRAINPKKTEFAFYMSMLFRMQLSILVNADHADAAEFSSGEQAPSDNGNTVLWEACRTFLEKKLSEFDNLSEIQNIRKEISRRLLERTNEKRPDLYEDIKDELEEFKKENPKKFRKKRSEAEEVLKMRELKKKPEE